MAGLTANQDISTVNTAIEVIPAPPVANEANQLVVDGWNNAQAYANSAFATSIGYLDRIVTAASGLSVLPAVSDQLGPVNQVIDQFVVPVTPQVSDEIGLNIPPVPTEPILNGIANIDISSAPEFTAQLPVLDLAIVPPQALSTSVPLAPTLSDVHIPAAPTIVLPDAPDLIGITVPVTPLLTLPVFTAVTPDSPLAPAFTFSFSETAYTSGLLTDLRARLQEWVDGVSTGLEPVVEQAIWDRDRTRQNITAARKIQEAARTFAARGFTKPPGALSIEIQDGLQELQNTLSNQSRDVAIKQADLEQSNRRFAFEQAWKVEEGLITYNNQIAQRAFDAAKYAQQATIDIFQQEVGRYVADVQAYSAKVEAFKVQLNAELTKLDIFKTELEAQKIIGELNVQAVEIYKARVEAVRTVVDIFRAQVESANAQAAVNRTQIEGFAAQVNAYGETVRAKASEYEAYATRIRAEVSKADVFKTQADAYNSQVNGFRALVDARVQQKNIEIKLGHDVPLDLFKTRTEVFRTNVEAEARRVEALNTTFSSQVRVFEAEFQGEASRVGSQATAYRAEADVAASTANVRIEAARANIQKLVQQIQLLVEATKSGAQVSAQLAASALSAVNLSGAVHSSVSNSASTSVSGSVSENIGYNASVSYNYTPV